MYNNYNNLETLYDVNPSRTSVTETFAFNTLLFFRLNSDSLIMENCCESLVKYFMVFFNILFILAGCVLIGFGAWSQIDAKDYLNFLGDNYVNTPIFLMIVGGVIFVVAFMGCCGAWKESKCLIYTYAFFLAVILVAQVSFMLSESFFSQVQGFDSLLFGKCYMKPLESRDPLIIELIPSNAFFVFMAFICHLLIFL